MYSLTSARLLRTAVLKLRKLPAKFDEEALEELGGLLSALGDNLKIDTEQFFKTPMTPEEEALWASMDEDAQESWSNERFAQDTIKGLRTIVAQTEADKVF